MRKQLEQALEDLNGLVRHFRLAQAYLNRNRKIGKDFRTLGSDWVRITHGAKNPLVIGLGGVEGNDRRTKEASWDLWKSWDYGRVLRAKSQKFT